MTASDDLSRLRDLLHDAPSPHVWDALADLLMAWPHDDASLDLALDYADRHLDRWPDGLRTLHRGHLPDLLPRRGRLSPVWPLGRRLSLGPMSPHDDLLALLTSDDQRLEHITGLGVGDVAFTHDQLRALGRLPWTERLRALALNHTHIDDTGLASLLTGHAFPLLEDLDLRHNALGELGAAALFGALERAARAPLRRLVMSYNTQLGEGGLRPLLTSDHVRHLHALDLSGIDLDLDNAEALRYARLSAVQHLALNDCALTDAPLRALLANPHLAALARLDLSGNPLGPDGCAVLADLAPGRLPALAHLNVRSALVDDAAARHLARAPWAAQLTHLNLAANGLSPAGLAHLLRSPLSAALSSLDLSDNALGAAGLRALADAPLHRLRNLYLQGTRVSTTGARHLAAAPWLGQLVGLSLDTSRLGPDGFAALLDRPDLRTDIKRALLLRAAPKTLKDLASAYRVTFEPRYLDRVTDALLRAVTPAP